MRGGRVGRSASVGAGAGRAGLSPAQAAERAARQSYGRLVALLASRSRDIAAAEDALAEAFAAALATWPARGVPDNPDAWLMTAARRNLGHARARAATAMAGEATMILLDEERLASAPVPFGDARLELMFACTHPAIAADVQAPLMLQCVLGLDAALIARAFLVSSAAMGQQLVRAKAKIKGAGIAFAVPDADAIGDRTEAVLAAIYAAYGTGWEDVLGADAKRRGLTGEAIWLARLVVELLPETPEPMGLLALMLYCEARRDARRDADGAFVPLDRQDWRAWDKDAIENAEALLRAATRFEKPGRFQTEAAIQSLHVEQRRTGGSLAPQLAALYDMLMVVAPSTGAAVARAVAHAEAERPLDALEMLDALSGGPTYQPWWVARARVHWLLGDAASARSAAKEAAAMTDDPSIRDFLLGDGVFRPPTGSA